MEKYGKLIKSSGFVTVLLFLTLFGSVYAQPNFNYVHNYNFKYKIYDLCTPSQLDAYYCMILSLFVTS